MKYRLEREMLSGRRCLCGLPEGSERAEALFVCHVGEEAERLMTEALSLLPRGHAPVAFAAVEEVSWDADYTPWSSDCLSGREFSGGAQVYLQLVQERLIPWAEQITRPARRYALGYSLGGLCALYSLTRGEDYDGGASVSGALWYPGFLEYFEAHRPDCPVYCSLGRAESRTRNPVMAGSAACAQTIASRPGDRFDWTNGNHFFEISQRIARAVQALSPGEANVPSPVRKGL